MSVNGKVQAICDSFWGGYSLVLSLILGTLAHFWEVMFADLVCQIAGVLAK